MSTPSPGGRPAAGGILPLLLLTGRPASGKSEILEYLRRTPAAERRRRFHIGEPVVLDDFPLLWAWFEEDHLLAEMGPSACTPPPTATSSGPTCGTCWCAGCAWNTTSWPAGTRAWHEHTTVLLEFSRGSEHGGYARAFAHLSEAVLERLAVLYVRVSFQESLRKNRRRFNPDRPHSILEHALPDEKLARLYGEDDWDQLAARSPFPGHRGAAGAVRGVRERGRPDHPRRGSPGKAAGAGPGRVVEPCRRRPSVRILKACPPPMKRS